MKTVNLLFLIILFMGACSSPKKTAPPKEVSPAVSRADILRGGTSFGNAVVIKVKSERAGLDEEYKWLSNVYPGYSLIRRTSEKRSSRYYDIIRIKTREGQLKDVYFDSTSFLGRGD